MGPGPERRRPWGGGAAGWCVRHMVTAICGAALLLGAAVGCGQSTPTTAGGDRKSEPLVVIAAESFLADIAQNVAGSRLTVQTLMPRGTDPHTFEPTPGDIKRVADCQVLIVNGSGFEGFLEDMLQGAGGERVVIEASQGLTGRRPDETEQAHGHEPGHEDAQEHEHGDIDPHFWLDPVNVKTYVRNIQRGLASADPTGAEQYAANAAAYLKKLDELDAWVRAQAETVPEARRLLVTDHHSFGYYADRYGFRVVGAVMPSVSTGASPSAQQMAELISTIKAAGAPAIFLATGTNPQLAEQIARDAGVRVVTGLFTHSVSEPGGKAPTYIDMIRYDTTVIVEALR